MTSTVHPGGVRQLQALLHGQDIDWVACSTPAAASMSATALLVGPATACDLAPGVLQVV